ncbi:hypothetical protein [Thermoflexus sp.]|uniref:hypothetical protein n=1 Tax=Thermoflexus sp. TaxID=1969742 RepID=UPI0034588766
MNTHAFSCLEVEFLKKALESRFGIQSSIHRVVRGQYVIYIPSGSARQFCDIIRHYVPPCMEYKLL